MSILRIAFLIKVNFLYKFLTCLMRENKDNYQVFTKGEIKYDTNAYKHYIYMRSYANHFTHTFNEREQRRMYVDSYGACFCASMNIKPEPEGPHRYCDSILVVYCDWYYFLLSHLTDFFSWFVSPPFSFAHACLSLNFTSFTKKEPPKKGPSVRCLHVLVYALLMYSPALIVQTKGDSSQWTCSCCGSEKRSKVNILTYICM